MRGPFFGFGVEFGSPREWLVRHYGETAVEVVEFGLASLIDAVLIPPVFLGWILYFPLWIMGIDF